MKQQSRTKENLIFGQPEDFFAAFTQFDSLESPLQSPLLAFKANLSSAFQVGSVPFQLIRSAVLDQRFNQLMIAETIRGEAAVLEGEIAEAEKEKVAFEAATAAMETELADRDVIKNHAARTLETLDRYLSREDFLASAQELLRQVLVMCWAAFEILINDTLRILMNNKPAILKKVYDTKPYRDLLSSRTLFDALEANRYDLSSVVGDLFCEVIKLDSLEKIRDAIHLTLAEPSVDILLKDERLWRIAQQRHLIVHRRGLVDARYVERTSDRAKIGEHIKFDAFYVKASLALVRDIGCEFSRVAQRRLAED